MCRIVVITTAAAASGKHAAYQDCVRFLNLNEKVN